ncbi:MAG: carbohydrate ABC transporter permease [Actinomycetes bacterium]
MTAMTTEAPSGRTAATHRAKGAGPRRRSRVTPVGAALTLGSVLLAFVWLMPLLWAADTALKPEAETTKTPLTWTMSDASLESFRAILGAGDIIRWFVNSTVVTVLVTLLTLALCALAAFGFSRMRFPGQGWLFAAVVAGILIPPQVLIVPLFHEMTALGLVDTYWGMVLPQVVTPVFVFVLKKFFDGLPRDYEEAARIDGAGSLRVFWSVVLPMSKPILAAVGIFVFIHCWNNFLWPFIVTTNPDMMTIPVGLYTVQGTYGLRYAQVMASALLGGIPLLLVYMLFQRQVVRGVGDAGLKA